MIFKVDKVIAPSCIRANYIDRRVHDPNVYIFRKENQNLLENPPLNFREDIPPRVAHISHFGQRMRGHVFG